MAIDDTSVFPSVDDRPGAPVVIFDGRCRFCIANMRWLRTFDADKIAYASLHDPLVAERWPDLTFDQLMQEIYLIDEQGERHRGAAAFRYLSRRLVGLWFLAPFLHIPGSLPVWQFLYKQVARIRYRFGRVETCEDDACSVHFGGKRY